MTPDTFIIAMRLAGASHMVWKAETLAFEFLQSSHSKGFPGCAALELEWVGGVEEVCVDHF